MIELPEAVSLARQINETVTGKRITSVITGHTPHKLVWHYGEPADYAALLTGRTAGEAAACGGMLEIKVENARILLSDGAAPRLHGQDEPRPPKHQLLVEFEDGCALSVSVRMYGGIGSFLEGELDNPYYQAAREKPSPLTETFDAAYFGGIAAVPEVQELRLKAMLATEQRIPGLGNGVLQDILFNAKLHPKRKVNTLAAAEIEALYRAVTGTLAEMAAQHGRDTEADLFGKPGGYATRLSRNTVNKPCPVCGQPIKKEAYMGGSIYYCPGCQPL